MEQINIYPAYEDKVLIIEASKLLGLKPAQFVKSQAVQAARRLLKGVEQTA